MRLKTSMRLLVAGLTAAVGLMVAAPAYADSPWGLVDCQQNPTDPYCVVQVSTSGGPGAAGGSGSSSCRWQGELVPCFVPGRGWFSADDGCYYRLATGVALGAAEEVGGPAVPPDRWYEGSCGRPADNYWPVTRLRLFSTAPGPALLAAEAVRNLRLPAPLIRLNPAAPAPQVVGVPTWLWISGWGVRSATASAGGASVTATARPVRVLWSTGDGATVTCRGPGTPWRPGMDPAAASPTCGHTYRVASTSAPGRVFTVRATVTWQVSWSGAGGSGNEPDLQTTGSVAVRVTEAQAINTGGGGS